MKDLVVLLDTGQASAETFNLAVNVVSELFDTFRIGDSVNVVTFDSTTAALMQTKSVRKFHSVTSAVSPLRSSSCAAIEEIQF